MGVAFRHRQIVLAQQPLSLQQIGRHQTACKRMAEVVPMKRHDTRFLPQHAFIKAPEEDTLRSLETGTHERSA